MIVLLVLSPILTGMITNTKDNLIVKHNNNNIEYYNCITKCQESTNSLYGKDYYGTKKWNDIYTECWDKYCKKFSN